VSTGKKGLGRGFDVLIPQDVDTAILFDEHEKVQKISVDSLIPNPDQPRTTFDEEALQQLAESIKQYGVLQPLIVTPHGKGTYAIVAGERRWLEIALVENVQRVDLSPLEQALSIERLHQQFSMTYEAIARRLGKASSTVNNIVRLLQLPKDAQQALTEGSIFEGHARAILSLKDSPDKQQELLNNILRYGWSVRQAEQFVVSFREGFKEAKAARERMRTETPATKRLSKKLGGMPVHIRRMAKGGKLEIRFKTDEELERIFHNL
jgi:ParB family chromosome partitioning protein